MALGILAALPFRHSPQSGANSASQTAADDATLGKGVALQVPGQNISTPSQVFDLRPMPAKKESEEPAKEEEIESKLANDLTPPPRLPDEYYPLYRPDKRHRVEPGRVVSSDKRDTSERQRPRTHTIRDGDTLPRLAQRYLGDPARGGEILNANPSVLSDPEVLPIGAEIVIPREDPPAKQADTDAPSDIETHQLVPLPPLDGP